MVLGVDGTATETEIRAAYRRLARTEHPDADGSDERFIILTWAYETLSDPETRAAFDAAGDSWVYPDDEEWAAYEGAQDRGSSRPVASQAVLDFGTISAGGLSRALRVDVYYDADPPLVDYEPRSGRYWRTDAVAADDDEIAVRIEVTMSAAAGSPSGDVNDRIVVTFDKINSTEIEIRGKVLGAPVGAETPKPPTPPPPRSSGSSVPTRRTAAFVSAGPPRSTVPKKRRHASWSLAGSITFDLALIVGVGVLASLIACPWAATTFQKVSGVIPYGEGLRFLLTVAACTGCIAVALSICFDVYAWSIGSGRSAIRGWPAWQGGLVFAAAILAPALYFATHYGDNFARVGGSNFGPPKLFWWLGPIAMVAAHGISLLFRATEDQ
jgi:hypothetical protein